MSVCLRWKFDVTTWGW